MSEVIVYHGGTESEDPVKSPVIQEIIMSNRIGAISVELAKRLNIEPACFPQRGVPNRAQGVRPTASSSRITSSS